MGVIQIKLHNISVLAGTIVAIITQSMGASGQTVQSREQRLSMRVELAINEAQMSDLMKQISSRYGIGMIADGTPMLSKTNFAFSGTLHEALDRIADTFDYTFSITKSGVVLFYKRFKNPDDRPQLNLNELRKSVKDMLTALPLIESDPKHEGWGAAIRELAQSMTPEQVQYLKGGKRLLFNDLQPAQQLLLARAIDLRCFGTVRGQLELVSFCLEQMDSSIIQAVDSNPKLVVPPGAQKDFNIFHIAHDKHDHMNEKYLGTIKLEKKP